MKKLNTLTLAGFGLCGILLAWKALDLADAGITLLLMVWRGYGYGAAAARAPLILWGSICLLAGLGLSLYSLHQEHRQYSRKVHKEPEHTVKPSGKRKVG